MPMFVNGTAGTLQAARDFGFDTFDDLSKHDYDSEIDNSKRLNDMLDSAQNFPEPNKEIVERLKENKNRFLQKEFLWEQTDENIFESRKYRNLKYAFFNCPIPEYVESDFKYQPGGKALKLKGTDKMLPLFYFREILRF